MRLGGGVVSRQRGCVGGVDISMSNTNVDICVCFDLKRQISFSLQTPTLVHLQTWNPLSSSVIFDHTDSLRKQVLVS